MDALLGSIKKYIRLSAAEARLVQGLFVEHKVAKGYKILEEGQTCRHLSFVAKGIFRHYIHDGRNEQTIHFSSENSFICDFNSLTAQQPSIKNIEALEDAVLLRIAAPALEQLYREVQEGNKLGRLLVEEAFNHSIRHINAIKTDSPTQRYRRFLDQYSAIQQRVPQFHIASFIGVTPQSLSRIRRRIAAH